MLTRPAFRSRFSCARRVRISLARVSASMRWVRERSGVATAGLVGIFVAGGMGGESTSRARADKTKAVNSAGPQVEVYLHGGHLMVTASFAGLFQRPCAIGKRACLGGDVMFPLFASNSSSSAAIRDPARGSRN